MKMDTLRTLFLQELKDVYDAEHRIVEALPKMADAAHAKDLKKAFEDHLKVTKEQVKRLEKIFDHMGESPDRKTCTGIKGIISEGEDLIKKGGDPDVMDAGLIAAAQKVEHYEIATYGTLRTWAMRMGDMECCRLLQRTANEEGETDHKLTRIAEQHVNREAVEGETLRKAA